RFLVREGTDSLRGWNHPWIRRVDAVDVGTDLTVLGVESGGHRHCRGVAAAPSKRGHLPAVGHALVPGHHHDSPTRELVLHPEGAHLDDARVDVPVVRDDARLAGG